MTLTPIEQNELLGEIAESLIAAAPPNWQRLVFDFMAVGKHVDVGLGAALDNGARQPVPAPREVSKPLAKLRRGMYADGLGTWYSMDMVIDRPDRFQARFNRDDEPPFRTPPAPEQYALDQERYPRTPENTPPWFRAKLGS
ncbi:hypothetical protein [Amycolatopsis sp. WQ 127309]|uniref:hypothetical protein n=1 Tax=Amycolatopsis sp. WQ 127309 TaxID=2932773 RepID=UPI001FF43ADA|nr:hypothetical protein [Amycolatopsis sp. WQ 127309]UOZ07737.1 hypothetical protein MUY22_05450 [Amycolatopsis sp. WQ 127309]